MASKMPKHPNEHLRYHRKKRHWTQSEVADKLYSLCSEEELERGVINTNMVSRWELGEFTPSPFWQRKLCELFEVDPESLGFVMHPQILHGSANSAVTLVEDQRTAIFPLQEQGTTVSIPSPALPPPVGISISPQTQAIDTLLALRHELSGGHVQGQSIDNSGFSAYAHYEQEQQLSQQLLLGAGCVAPLLDNGWSPEDVLQVTNSLAKVVQAMPKMSRQQFLRNLLGFGVAAFVGGVPDFSMDKHVSEEDRAHLCQALSDSIVSGWKMFLSASNSQVLAIGQAQLSLVQQSDSLLYPSVRPFLYTGVYGLIGITLHFQERNSEALQSHRSGYIAALATGEPWYVAQSLICQSDCYQALGQFDSANQAIEEALRVIGTPRDDAQVCARAHLLTCWADNAMVVGDHEIAQEKLEAAGEYVDDIASNEEFDKASWHMLAGKYGLLTKNYTAALRSFEESLAALPAKWTLRQTMSTIGLAIAYARLRERDKSLSVAETLIPMVQTINAEMTNNWFAEYLRQDMHNGFPRDERVRRFVTDTYKRLPQLAGNVG